MPKREYGVIDFTGDRNPLDYGGGVIYRDGHGSVTWEFWDEPEPDESSRDDDENEEEGANDRYDVYRVDVPDDVFAYHDWAKIPKIAETIGVDPAKLEKAGKSRNPLERVAALQAIESHYGANELDYEPVKYTRKELEKRWEYAWNRRGRRSQHSRGGSKSRLR